MIRWKKKMTVCYVDSSNLGATMRAATQQITQQFGEVIDLTIIPLATLVDPRTAPPHLDALAAADLVLVDIRGTNPVIADILSATRRGKATVASLMGGSFELMSLTRMGIFDAHKFFNSSRAQKMQGGFSSVSGDTNFDDIDAMLKDKLPGFVYKDIGAWFEVTRYWRISGVENVKRMLLMFARNYGKVRGMPPVEPALIIPSPSIRRPLGEETFDSLDAYRAATPPDPTRPTVVMVYYDGMHYDNSAVPAAALMKELEKTANVVPISCDGIKNLDAVEKLAVVDGQCVGDAIVHLTWFRLNGGPLGGDADRTDRLLRDLNVPVFHPVSVFMDTVKNWEESGHGLSPVDYLANVMLPETDGAIEPLLLCATDESPDAACRDVVPLLDGLNAMRGASPECSP